MTDEFKTQQSEDEYDEAKMVENLNKITAFLNYFGKEYEVKMWESGGGVDVIITELDTDEEDMSIPNLKYYKQVISINYNGFLKFEKQSEAEKK